MRGVDGGKLVFRCKFLDTDGFNLYFIPPEPIDFDAIFTNFDDRLADSYIVLIVILLLCLILIMLTIVCLLMDRRDNFKVGFGIHILYYMMLLLSVSNYMSENIHSLICYTSKITYSKDMKVVFPK